MLENNGIIDNEMARSRIGRMRLAEQLPDEERRDFYVMDTNSAGFRTLTAEGEDRQPDGDDQTQVPVATRAERTGFQAPALTD